MVRLTLPSRRDSTVRAIARDWRRLTSPVDAGRAGPGAPTLIACSGGADSSALAIALAVAAGDHAPGLLGVAHIVHDLRPKTEALADRDAAAELAERLGLRFVEAGVTVRATGGNLEAAARRERYRALAALAHEGGFAFVATAHHAHDQLETVLMALVRGGGPRGWRAIAERRVLGGVAVIRPMLAVSPDEARALCGEAGWAWREDETNRDTKRLRAALRARVLPGLLSLRPAAARNAGQFARRAREMYELLDEAATALGPPPWDRRALRAAPALVVGEALRRHAQRTSADRAARRDGPPARTIEAAVRAIRSSNRGSLEIPWPGAVVRASPSRVWIDPVS